MSMSRELQLSTEKYVLSGVSHAWRRGRVDILSAEKFQVFRFLVAEDGKLELESFIL